jgi:phospholipase C
MTGIGLFLLMTLTLVANVTTPAALAASGAPSPSPKPATPIEHFLVVMQENHTFDNYFGTYPGADGIPAGTCMPVQPNNPANKDCIKPFHLVGGKSTDLDHSAQTSKLQYANGQMNGFVEALEERNQDGAMAMGYYNDEELPYYWNLADQYVLFDRFFSSTTDGSDANHMYWVAASPSNRQAEASPDGYGDLETIFDRLQASGVSWKFYVQNYDPKLTYRTVTQYPGNRASQVIWVPLLKIPRFIDDPKLSSHIVPLTEYFDDLHNGTLPAVSYIVPSGASEHPPSSLISGQRFVQSLINSLMQSSSWKSSAFMLAYDDWGGWYDHVKPPAVDQYGYGFRVPALLVSPYAKQGYIDNTTLDFTSMLKFIEQNWNVKPLTERDAKANNLLDAFDFTAPPRQAAFVSWDRHPTVTPEPRRGVLYAAYGGALGITGLIIASALLLPRRRRWFVRARTGSAT